MFIRVPAFDPCVVLYTFGCEQFVWIAADGVSAPHGGRCCLAVFGTERLLVSAWDVLISGTSGFQVSPSFSLGVAGFFVVFSCSLLVFARLLVNKNFTSWDVLVDETLKAAGFWKTHFFNKTSPAFLWLTIPCDVDSVKFTPKIYIQHIQLP